VAEIRTSNALDITADLINCRNSSQHFQTQKKQNSLVDIIKHHVCMLNVTSSQKLRKIVLIFVCCSCMQLKGILHFTLHILYNDASTENVD